MSLIINATDDSFDTDVLQSDTPVLVDFWASWCAPCKAIAPVLEDLAEEYDGKMTIAKVDIVANEGTASKFAVRSIPALFVFKNGEIVDQVVGALPRSKLAAFIEKNVAD